VLLLGWFVLGLKMGWSVTRQVDPDGQKYLKAIAQKEERL